MAIQYWNQRKSRLETEDVYGDTYVKLLYGNPIGYALTDSFLVRKAISRAYGALQSGPRSGKKIAGFVRKFGIPMDDYAEGPFASFNDFFIRQFRPGLRPYPDDCGVMGAPAEARYLAFAHVDSPLDLPVKGMRLDPISLLGKTPGKERFRGGPCLLARLCPVDYHRYHFPDSGKVSHFHEETGKLHSVNPLALKRNPKLFLGNERHISLLETENFGTLAYVEVGALCVGKIVQSGASRVGAAFKRGEEKGYFLFGGSTVVVYGEPGRWLPNADLLERSAQGLETLLELGAPVALSQRIPPA
ncbi:MAG: phosphatidylserine decarboxylase [Proteobacteria bacterium]|nr:MAG: phosphatidylserine decarboxylase [Pseudomonadota bacterium]